jgi:flagellar FliL protein
MAKETKKETKLPAGQSATTDQPIGKPEEQATDASAENAEQPVKEEKPKKKLNMKLLFIGLPLFIIQLVAVYFITANFLMSSNHPGSQTEEAQNELKTDESVELGKYVFLIEDIIVNPTDTDGKRLLLTSIGLDLKSEEAKQELKSKEVIVKDVIITSLSSKTWAQLTNSVYKDSMKNEISTKIEKLIPSIKINTVYLSKYITQ